ncbi:hypothetical protein GH740_00925 [Microbacterium sp. SYP-A9085]|nr:hypothetical protein [Microbacterium sp. SYP-A9085]MRH27880.1 hypothetical protein [Microbacterium sp. SYP-A9085]
MASYSGATALCWNVSQKMWDVRPRSRTFCDIPPYASYNLLDVATSGRIF